MLLWHFRLSQRPEHIYHQVFPWLDEQCPNNTIYPVLVIADNRLLADGLSSLLQRWYNECLLNEGINWDKEKPLILMSPITLLKYKELFIKDGFEKYFEEYYKTINHAEPHGIGKGKSFIL